MIRKLEEVIAPTKELFLDKFPHKEKYLDNIIDVLLARVMVQLRLDLSTKSFLQIYQEYALPVETLESTDLTKSEIEKLINEANLSERDAEIARLKYLEYKSDDYIADKTQVDKKTIRANMPKISTRLKRTAFQLYRSHKKEE